MSSGVRHGDRHRGAGRAHLGEPDAPAGHPDLWRLEGEGVVADGQMPRNNAGRAALQGPRTTG